MSKIKLFGAICSSFILILILLPISLDDVSGACPPATIILDDPD